MIESCKASFYELQLILFPLAMGRFLLYVIFQFSLPLGFTARGYESPIQLQLRERSARPVAPLRICNF